MRPPPRGWVAVAVAVFWTLAAACARPGSPSGGPRDLRPPVLVSVTPDTFAVVEAGEGEIRMRFDETISERVTRGTMENAVIVSPRTGEVEVDHSGDEVTVRLEGGFRPGTVYRVTVLPVLTDRFNNPLVAPFEWVFSTGPEFQATAVAGEIWDRITGDPVEGVTVQALTPDSVPYVGVTDSAGVFALRYLPAGPYALSAFEDRNQDDVPDPFEPQGMGDRLALGVADTVFTSLSVMVPDTTPPRLAQGEKVDSTTLRLTFDDHLDPTQDVSGSIRELRRDSAAAPTVRSVFHEWEYEEYRRVQDSIAAAERARAAADSAAADTASAEGETPAPTIRTPTGATGPARDTAGPVLLPNGERVPLQTLVVILASPIEGGDLYGVDFGPLRNISGLTAEADSGFFRLDDDPETPADSAAADSAAVDSLAAPPDTGVSTPPDTGGARPAGLRTGSRLPWERRNPPPRR